MVRRAFIFLQLLGVFPLFLPYVHIFKLKNLRPINYIIKNLIHSGKYSNSFILKDFAVAVNFLKHIPPGDA